MTQHCLFFCDFSCSFIYRSSRCFNLLNKYNISSLSPVSNCCQSQTQLWMHHHFYWLYHCPVILFLSLFLSINYLLLIFFLFLFFIYCYFLSFVFLLLIISCYFRFSLFLLSSFFISCYFLSFLLSLLLLLFIFCKVLIMRKHLNKIKD